MKRKTSTAKTRGMVTRIIATTTATVKAYDMTTDSVDDYNVEMMGAISEKDVIKTVFKSGAMDRTKYKILSVRDVQQTGRLYAMSIDDFIANAEIIEEEITND